MNQRNIFSLLILSIILLPMTGCFFFHESSVNGAILDIDTKQPIEGAIVVVVYHKTTIGLLGAGANTFRIGAQETLTDKNGKYHIPSYTTLISPLSWQETSEFIVYKPGYASLKFGFSEDGFQGKEPREGEGTWNWAKELKWKVRSPGIVELPKIHTLDEARQAKWDVSIFGDEITTTDLPILYKLLNNQLYFDKTVDHEHKR